MKKVILFLFVVFLYISILGCQPHPNNPGQTDEKHETGQTDAETPRSVYYFKSSRLYDENYVLTKTNLQTGITTPVCDDPLCEHGYDCRFANTYSTYMVGTTLYFYRDAAMFAEDDELYVTVQICSYDYETSDYNVLLELNCSNDDSICGKFEVKDGKIYFYQRTLVDNLKKYSLREINIETGELTKYDWGADTWHFAMHNGRLYFSHNTQGIYSTDLNLQDKQIIVTPPENTLIYPNTVTAEGKIFYGLRDENKVETLTCFDPATGATASIDTADSFGFFRVVGETAYYLKTTFVDGNAWMQDHGNTVYKWDGNEATVFYVHDKEILALNECEGYLILDEEGGERHVIKAE